MSTHGIAPGPTVMVNHPDLFWGVVASFFIGNVLLVVLNIPLIGIWVRLLRVTYQYLYPVIIVLICIGVYSVNNNVFDVALALLFGIVGYAMRLLGFEPAPLLIGFVLGPMMEENLRRGLLLARGDYYQRLAQPLTGPILSLTLLLVLWSLWKIGRAPCWGRECPSVE